MNPVGYIIYHVGEGIACVIPYGRIISLGCPACSEYLVISRHIITAVCLVSG